MVMKGGISIAYIIKCAILYCEIVSRTEECKDKNEAEKLFVERGWTYGPENQGWVCPNDKGYHR